jgi:hypothetical protein
MVHRSHGAIAIEYVKQAERDRSTHLVVMLGSIFRYRIEDDEQIQPKGPRWFFGTFLLTNVIDVVDSLFKGLAWATQPTYRRRYAKAQLRPKFAAGTRSMR